jgi:hypothetical protein
MRLLGLGRRSVRMVRFEVIFGTLRKGGIWVSDDEWAEFVEAEIIPSFPDGFTIITGEGRWRHSTGKFLPDKCKILVVWDKNPKSLSARSERVSSAYKQRFGLESVLSSATTANVSF